MILKTETDLTLEIRFMITSIMRVEKALRTTNLTIDRAEVLSLVCTEMIIGFHSNRFYGMTLTNPQGMEQIANIVFMAVNEAIKSVHALELPITLLLAKEAAATEVAVHTVANQINEIYKKQTEVKKQ